MDSLMLLSARNVSKSFGGLQAVRHVDFDIEDGEIHALIGPNGAGKTTFVSMLSGRISASEGSITFKGTDITSLPAYTRVRMGIAYTFQITSIYPQLSVYENVAIATRYRGSRNSAHKSSLEGSVKHTLDRVGLLDQGERKASELAYGHQRLLEISMGLALDPLLLILDEPTQGLSDSEIEDFCTLIRGIRSDTTILLIEHNLSVVMALAERITVLDQGSVLAQGAPQEIQDNEAVQAAYLGA